MHWRGGLIAEFTPVVTVGKAKKIPSLSCQFWFDKSNEEQEDVGGAGRALLVD